MRFFNKKPAVQENDIRSPFLTKQPSDLEKLRLAFKQDGRQEVPRKYLEMVLDQCLELIYLREAVKLFGQYKQQIRHGIDEQEHKGWHNKIQEAKKKLIDTNQQLFDRLELKTQHLAQVVQEQPLTHHNSEELEHQFAWLNHTRNAINILSELIGKALSKQQVTEQLPRIENLIPKEMQNMLTLLKSHISLQQSLESDFLKKLKRIGQTFLPEEEDLVPFEDNHDGNQINRLYERISTFIDKNQASLKNLRIFNQDIVNSLQNFIRQILQPLQKKKLEEINVVHILTNIRDVKQQLQRVLVSYKDYLQVNDQNSQEMEIKIKNYQNQEEENEKKLQALEEESKEKEAHIQRLTTETQKRNDELADVREKLVQKAKANKQLEEQNKTFQSMLSSIRRRLANLSQQKIQSEPAHSFQDVEDTLDRLEKDMKEMIENLNKAAVMIQSLTKQLRDSKERQIKLQQANKQSIEQLNNTIFSKNEQIKELNFEICRLNFLNQQAKQAKSKRMAKMVMEYDGSKMSAHQIHRESSRTMGKKQTLDKFKKYIEPIKDNLQQLLLKFSEIVSTFEKIQKSLCFVFEETGRVDFSDLWSACLRRSSITSYQLIELSRTFNVEAKNLLSRRLGIIEKISAEVSEANSELQSNIGYLNDSFDKISDISELEASL